VNPPGARAACGAAALLPAGVRTAAHYRPTPRPA